MSAPKRIPVLSGLSLTLKLFQTCQAKSPTSQLISYYSCGLVLFNNYLISDANRTVPSDKKVDKLPGFQG